MHGSAHPGGYVVVAIVLVGLALTGPRVWATPDQTRPGQMTVPTPTPKGQRTPTVTAEPSVTPAPTAPPSATPAGCGRRRCLTPTQISGPGPTSAPSQTAVPQPTPTASPQATAGPGARLTLVKEADREEVWPGATVQFTLKLTNTGTGSVRQVSLADTLPDGLDPGAVLAGDGVAWDGRTLRGQVAILPPEAQVVIVFTAVVRTGVSPGGVLTNRATASAAGGLQAVAETTLVLPPAEMPPTGGVRDAVEMDQKCLAPR